MKAFKNQGRDWLQDITIRNGQQKSIGREAGRTDFPFPGDRHLSAVHFEIDCTGDVPWLLDRGSTNGTFLNGARVVSKQKLNSGETIHAGNTSFRVEVLQTAQVIAATIDRGPNEDQPVLQHAKPETDLRTNRQDSLQPAQGNSAKVITPIYDSSSHIVPDQPALAPAASPVAAPFPEQVAGPIRTPIKEVASYQLWRRRFLNDIESGMNVVLEKLNQKWSIQIVVHPRKIRQEQLSGSNIVPLWSWNPQMADFGPVALSWTEFQKYGSFIARYIAADAIAVFLGNDADAVQKRLMELSTCGVSGYSEPNGFLNCFWPSSLATMLDAGRQIARQELLSADIAGLVIPSPWDQLSILAVGSEQLTPSLADCEFHKVPHWYPES